MTVQPHHTRPWGRVLPPFPPWQVCVCRLPCRGGEGPLARTPWGPDPARQGQASPVVSQASVARTHTLCGTSFSPPLCPQPARGVPSQSQGGFWASSWRASAGHTWALDLTVSHGLAEAVSSPESKGSTGGYSGGGQSSWAPASLKVIQPIIFSIFPLLTRSRCYCSPPPPQHKALSHLFTLLCPHIGSPRWASQPKENGTKGTGIVEGRRGTAADIVLVTNYFK